MWIIFLKLRCCLSVHLVAVSCVKVCRTGYCCLVDSLSACDNWCPFHFFSVFLQTLARADLPWPNAKHMSVKKKKTLPVLLLFPSALNDEVIPDNYILISCQWAAQLVSAKFTKPKITPHYCLNTHTQPTKTNLGIPSYNVWFLQYLVYTLHIRQIFSMHRHYIGM